MAVINILSNQLTPPVGQQSAQIRNYPIDSNGKTRHLSFEIPASAITAIGDIGSTFDLVKLPYGRIRILPYACSFWCSAWGAGRTLSFGLRSYLTELNAVVAEDAAALASGVDVSAAVNGGVVSAALWKNDVFSRQGAQVFATLAGGTVPIGALLRGHISYIAE